MGASVKSWIDQDWRRLKVLKRLEEEIQTDRAAHFELQKQVGALAEGLSAEEQKKHGKIIALNTKIKYLYDKMKMNDARVAICNNKYEWVSMIVRSHLRRKSVIEGR